MTSLKEKLCNVVMLASPQKEGRFRLYTDWSKDALGACLHQVQNDGVERPIAFASRLTRGPEANLASSEGELAAFIYGLGKFRPYLGFAEFDAFTDSSALKTL
jgi:RNase H-like domain found in reverse transcriptase